MRSPPSRCSTRQAGLDHVFGLNVLLPPGLEGEDISGWERRRLGGMVAAGRQLGRASHIELARRAKRRLGDRLTLIEPVDLDEVTGLNFYDLFLDRRRWPELMRRGYEATHAALEPFRGGIEARPNRGGGSMSHVSARCGSHRRSRAAS